SAVLAMFLLNTAYTYLEVKKVSVISNSMIIVTIFAGVVLLKESFYWYHIVGSLLIIVGAIGVSIFDDAKDVSQGDEQREHNYCDQDNCNLGYGDDR
ncbi:MAG: DMT family transporter, partial [Tissierellia bacterium]|nr:DMT family transporter [Tissierellia bacterium]